MSTPYISCDQTTGPAEMSHQPPFIVVLLLGVLFSFVWSSAFVAGKVALQYADPISVLVFRFAAAATIILCTSVLAKRARLFDYRVVGHGAALGALNNAVYLGLTFKGLEYISPALTTLIISTAPFLTLTFCNLFLKERISFSQISGIIFGFIGVYFAISQHVISGSDMGIGLTFLGTASFALGTVCYRWIGDTYSAPQLNGGKACSAHCFCYHSPATSVTRRPSSFAEGHSRNTGYYHPRACEAAAPLPP